MLYFVEVSADCYDLKQEKWHPDFGPWVWEIRAVSRKHALNKAIKRLCNLPYYADREPEPHLKLTANAEIVGTELNPSTVPYYGKRRR